MNRGEIITPDAYSIAQPKHGSGKLFSGFINFRPTTNYTTTKPKHKAAKTSNNKQECWKATSILGKVVGGKDLGKD